MDDGRHDVSAQVKEFAMDLLANAGAPAIMGERLGDWIEKLGQARDRRTLAAELLLVAKRLLEKGHEAAARYPLLIVTHFIGAAAAAKAVAEVGIDPSAHKAIATSHPTPLSPQHGLRPPARKKRPK